MSRIVVLSHCSLNQRINGRTNRVGNLLEAAGRDALLCQPGFRHSEAETVILPFDAGRRKVGINWGIFNFYLPLNRGRTRRAVAAATPGAVVLTSMWDLPPVGTLKGIPLLLDAENVDAVYMEQRYGVDHWFTRLVARTERRVLERVDHVFCCSEQDLQTFQTRYRLPADKFSIVPNGVDSAHMAQDGSGQPIDPAIQARLNGRTVLFFMGKLDYAPNIEALRFMSETLMPELERRQPGRYVLLVTGRPVPTSRMHPAMIFAGLVPEIPPYISRATICLAPLFTGSGTRLKILECLGAGKPVVATPAAIEGIPAIDGRDAVIASAEDFAGHIVRLADQPEEARRIGAAGQAFVREHFDWSASRAGWSRVFDRFRGDQRR